MSSVVDRLRAVCLAFPEAREKDTWGHPTFRIRSRIFASLAIVEDPDWATIHALTVKAEPGEQESLVAEGHPFFLPRAAASKGWVGVLLDDTTDFVEIAELVEDSYRQLAPKGLVAQLDEQS
ncbi:MAG: MmcQ/YjbR family DNA-binding protein [Acidimicrobiales bacterium]|nr:MmcQ/YjbR family DNA-binding protein [Acidimicrobiales bacterium]